MKLNPPAVTDSILDLVGNTPMVRVRNLDTGPCELYLKLENQNPGGSIKDRIAMSMIEVAEREGKLKPGGTVIEATAGNTGLGLALVASQKGYRLILVIPDKMSQEKVFHLRAMGAEVVMTRSDVGKGHPEYYQDVAQRIAKETPGAFYINQFSNPANTRAHLTTTGPEIWEQMGHRLDAVVAGVGSGGTIAGLTQFFRGVDPKVEMVLADPAGSILVDYIKTGKYGEAGSWLVEGIGEDFIPDIADLSGVKSAYTVTDRESFETARLVLRKEGVLVGSSSGTLIAAALRYCRDQKTPKRVVTFACDSGNKYLSKMFNDFWMVDQGFIQREEFGDLRDLIARRHWEGGTVTVSQGDTLMTAYKRMRIYEVSQLPVLEQGRIVGFLDESDLLLSIEKGPSAFQRKVSDAMNTQVTTVSANSPIESLMPIFNEGQVAVVVDGQQFLGIITRIDLINHLRRQMAKASASGKG